MTEQVPEAMQRQSQQSSAAGTVKYAPEHEWPRLVHVSERMRRAVDRIGRFGAWMIVPLVLITVMDVSIRKVGLFQIMLIENFGRIFDSTVLQELEWHFHTGLFALVLGYGYIWNTHVRVDLVREHLHFRKKAWLEFLGLTFFLIPYTCIVVYFAFIYAMDSYAMNEISASTVGLTHRWIIKSVLVVGLCFVHRRRGVGPAPGDGRPVGTAGQALSAHDPGMAGGSGQQDRGQGAAGPREGAGRAQGPRRTVRPPHGGELTLRHRSVRRRAATSRVTGG